jgi:hypothetical protein
MVIVSNKHGIRHGITMIFGLKNNNNDTYVVIMTIMMYIHIVAMNKYLLLTILVIDCDELI